MENQDQNSTDEQDNQDQVQRALGNEIEENPSDENYDNPDELKHIPVTGGTGGNRAVPTSGSLTGNEDTGVDVDPDDDKKDMNSGVDGTGAELDDED